MYDRAQQARRRGRAFGLELDAGFDLCGLSTIVESRTDGRLPRVVLDLAHRRDLIAHESSAGHLLDARGYGMFLVSGDGSRVLCAPADAMPWRWQRYLVGQVLPLAAVLHGFEVFHASVVELGGRAVAFVGPSHAGKSSIAAALFARGAGFVSDDLLVVRTGEDTIRAWPGFGLTSLRHDALGLLPASTKGVRGRIGADGDEVRLAVEVVPSPLPLASVYFVERAPLPDRPLVAPLDPVDPRLLLAGSYVLRVRTPDRLTRHLDTCAHVARGVAAFRISVPPGVRPMDVATAVESNAMAESRSSSA
jgi:hypothetical protein